jgi:hypothetical protein
MWDSAYEKALTFVGKADTSVQSLILTGDVTRNGILPLRLHTVSDK